MVRHKLASGEYNDRRADCETGVKMLRAFLPEIRALRDVTIECLEKYKSDLPSNIYRRCRHVITENQRVHAAAKALQTGDTERFGHLMYRSHASLRDDYDVSSRELDTLVDLAASRSAVYGARMTGAGFGGCTVNAVRADCADAFPADITRSYADATGIKPEVYVCEPAQGAHAWPVEGSGQG